MRIYIVRRAKCGCLISSRPAREQSTPIGSSRQHPDGSTSLAMPLESAAVVPEICSACFSRGYQRGPVAQAALERLMASEDPAPTGLNGFNP